ncbi:ABC transporter permease [Sodalis ligni]|jgi:ribose transport system permease protein|uniref:Ribose transport system permease protein/fructose transport system permease protein n=1 Tax=Sodalis ligni TaxID=2697027 RepID=A0A4R1NGU1_9GAMM|nr:ABC transporter permease [Sodalis ligni]TCL06723.1 ribose transport system permease protein/fructose transport system permease protein [Sodalis ligni]
MINQRSLLRWGLDFAPLLLLALLLVIFGGVDSRIVSVNNLNIIVLQATSVALLGLAMFWILLVGEIDLSAGNLVSFSAVTMGTLLSSGYGLVPSLAVGLFSCLFFGLINGLMVAILKLPSFIATLVTTLILQGATLMVAKTGTILVLNPLLRRFGAFTSAYILPPTVLFVIIIAALCWWLAKRTAFGLKTYAIGSSAERAVLAGISVRGQKVCVFLVSSVLVFFTATVVIARIPVVNPNVGGISLLLDAIAAAVIGGTSLFGGRGMVAGVICGALIISLLTAALRILGIDPSSLDLYKGLIIICILLLDQGLSLIRQKRKQAV